MEEQEQEQEQEQVQQQVEVNKPVTIGTDGTLRNDHWAEFYLTGTLCAHTVVLVIDDGYGLSDFSQGELDGFLENCRRAQSFKSGDDAGRFVPEPEVEVAPEAETKPEDEPRFPGSEFELVVVYEQGMFVGANAKARMDALRARFSDVGATSCTFFHAW